MNRQKPLRPHLAAPFFTPIAPLLGRVQFFNGASLMFTRSTCQVCVCVCARRKLLVCYDAFPRKTFVWKERDRRAQYCNVCGGRNCACESNHSLSTFQTSRKPVRFREPSFLLCLSLSREGPSLIRYASDKGLPAKIRKRLCKCTCGACTVKHIEHRVYCISKRVRLFRQEPAQRAATLWPAARKRPIKAYSARRKNKT